MWYDILAFSRPRQALARLGYPLMRKRQRRFGRESAAAMRRAVAASASLTGSLVETESQVPNQEPTP